MVILIIILALSLIMLIPVGADMALENGNFSLKLTIASIGFTLYPSKSKKQKEKKQKEPKKQKKEKKKKLQFSLKDYLEIAKIALKSINRFFHNLKVSRMKLHYISSDADPFTAADRYNKVCAAVSALSPLGQRILSITNRDIYLAMDLEKEKSVTELGIALSVRIGQLLLLAVIAGCSFLKVYIKRKAANRRKERTEADGK